LDSSSSRFFTKSRVSAWSEARFQNPRMPWAAAAQLTPGSLPTVSLSEPSGEPATVDVVSEEQISPACRAHHVMPAPALSIRNGLAADQLQFNHPQIINWTGLTPLPPELISVRQGPGHRITHLFGLFSPFGVFQRVADVEAPVPKSNEELSLTRPHLHGAVTDGRKVERNRVISSGPTRQQPPMW